MAEDSHTRYRPQTTYYQQLSGQAIEQLETGVSTEWQVGDVILDLYEITGLLGEGGMGKVFRAHHRGWNIDLAVKSPKAEVFTNQKGKELFIQEAETWVNLGLHPHIAACYYVRTLGGVPRIFAECVEGGSLESWIESRRLYEGGKERALECMLDIAIQFAWGLAYAHEQGLVHQDVKPHNVLMTPEGAAKVTDFGLAKAHGAAGTPAYQSPEQALGGELTRTTDIWSWAVSVLEMFTGGVTWMSGLAAAEVLDIYLESGSHEKSIPPMPKALAELLRRCFQQHSHERLANMTDIAARLTNIYLQVVGQTYVRPAPQASALQGDSLNNKALSLYDLGQISEAKALWQTNLQANPGHLETTYNLGLVLWRASQKDDAELLRDLDAAAVSSEHWRLDWLMAQVHLERGDVEQTLANIDALPAEVAARKEPAEVRHQAYELENSGYGLCHTFTGHTSEVNSVCLSAAEDYALSGSDDFTLKLWNISTALKGDGEAKKSLRTFTGHTKNVTSVCFSRDGRHALSGSFDSTLKLWDVATGKCLRTFSGHTQEVWSVCMSKDERYALSGSFDNTLKLWDVATGQCVRTFTGHTNYVTSVCMSEDGRYALSGSWDTTLKYWEVATGKCLHTIKGHKDYYVASICLSKDGRFALSGSYDKTLKLWDISTALSAGVATEARMTFTGHSGWVTSVCLSEDGRYSLSGSNDKTLKLWDIATGTCLRTFAGHKGWVGCIGLSSDVKYVLSGSFDKTVKLWDVSTEHNDPAPFALSRVVASEQANKVARLMAEAQIARQQGDTLREVSILRHARSVPGYEHNAEIREAWSRLYLRMRKISLRAGWLEVTFEGHTNFVQSVCLSGDGRYALSGSFDKTLKLWEVATGQCLRTLEGHMKAVVSVYLSRDGGYALSGSMDKTLKLWEVATGQCLHTYEGHLGDVYSVYLSADGRYALSGCEDKTLKFWDVAAERCLHTFEGHTHKVNSVCLSVDGRYALSGGDDKTIRLWDIATGQHLRTFTGHKSPVYSVCLSGDGLYALSGGFDKTLRLWELATGKCLRTIEIHSFVYSAYMSADGRYALSGGLDDTLRFWELATGRCLRTFTGHMSYVSSVYLSRDGRYVLSGSWDNTFKLWELDWELEDTQPADWDEGARPYLQIFLTLHPPTRGGLFQKPKPGWTEADFQQLMLEIGYCGYGWLRPEGVRGKLEEMARGR